jgi:hypothetical protein
LGRHPGRGDARVFEERAAHVRGQISRLTAAAKQTRNPDTSSACNPPPTEFEEERHDRRQDTSALNRTLREFRNHCLGVAVSKSTLFWTVTERDTLGRQTRL